MALNQIQGIVVSECLIRKGHRTLFYRKEDTNKKMLSFHYTLLLFLKGKVKLTIGGKAFVVGRHDAVLYSGRELQEVTQCGGTAADFYRFSFNLLSEKNAWLNPFELGFKPFFRIRNLAKFIRLFRALNGIWRSKAKYRSLEITIRGLNLIRFLHESLQKTAAESADDQTVMDKRIRSALILINENIKNAPDDRTLAQKAGMHPTHFIRLFKRVVGMPPKQYILERKTQKAKDFMCIYGDPPTSTALELGFHDYSHFYHVFKQRTGLSPLEYMKRHRRKTVPLGRTQL